MSKERVDQLLQALDLDPEQVSEEDRDLLEKSLDAWAPASDEAGTDAEDADDAEDGSEEDVPEDPTGVLTEIGKSIVMAMLKGNDFSRLAALFRALAEEDEPDEDEEDLDDEAGDDEFGDLSGDDSGGGEPSDKQLESDVAEILGDDEEGAAEEGEAEEGEEEGEEEEDEAARLKRQRKSLAEAVEEAGVGDEEGVEFIDPQELAGLLSKSVTAAVSEELKPVRTEIAELRKSVDLLEQQPASSHPYAVMEKGFTAEDGPSINRADVLRVTQDALVRELDGFTLKDATNMQKAVGTENWTQYDAQFQELVRDLSALEKDG